MDPNNNEEKDIGMMIASMRRNKLPKLKFNILQAGKLGIATCLAMLGLS